MLAENIHSAPWPQMFRVSAFRVGDGGFTDVGTFPLETFRTDKIGQGWAWLLDQLVAIGALTFAEAGVTDVEIYHGRSMALINRLTKKKFMLLLPA